MILRSIIFLTVVGLFPPTVNGQSMVRLAPEPVDYYAFGSQLAFIDGELLVGTRDHGIQVFSEQDGAWIPGDTLRDPDGTLHVGRFVSVTDSMLFLVTTPHVFSYARSGGSWNLSLLPDLPDAETQPLASSGKFAMVGDSLLLLNQSRGVQPNPFGEGWVDVYRIDGGEWVLAQTIDPSPGIRDNFRFACSTPDRLVFGAPRDPVIGDHAGSVYVYRRGDNGQYVFEQKIIPTDLEEADQFGRSITCIDTGLVIHSSSGGKTYYYTRTDSVWQEASRIVVPGSNRSLQIAQHGDLLKVCNWQELMAGGGFVYYESTVYLLELDNTVWRIRHRIRSPTPVDLSREIDDGGFGAITVHSGDYLAIAADGRNGDGVQEVGEVYVTRFSELPVTSSTHRAPNRSEGIHVYPNPAGSTVNVLMSSPEARDVSFEVFDVLGRRRIMGEPLQLPQGLYTHQIGTVGLEAGIYHIVACVDGGSCAVRPFVVVK